MKGNVNSPEYNHLFKVMLLGDDGVGKSCMLLRFTDDTYTESYIGNIGSDFKTRTVDFDGDKVKLQIWDAASRDRFKTITSDRMPSSHGVIIAYDVTNAESFNNVRNYVNNLNRHSSQNVEKIIVGTKSDAISRRAVTFDQGKEFADSLGIGFVEISSKNNKNVEEAFMTLTSKMMSRIKPKKAPAQEQLRKSDTSSVASDSSFFPSSFSLPSFGFTKVSSKSEDKKPSYIVPNQTLMTNPRRAELLHEIIRENPSDTCVNEIKELGIGDETVYTTPVGGKTAIEAAAEVISNRANHTKYNGRSNGNAAKYLLSQGVSAFDLAPNSNTEQYNLENSPFVKFARQGKKETICEIVNRTTDDKGIEQLLKSISYLRENPFSITVKRKIGTKTYDGIDSLLGSGEKAKIDQLMSAKQVQEEEKNKQKLYSESSSSIVGDSYNSRSEKKQSEQSQMARQSDVENVGNLVANQTLKSTNDTRKDSGQLKIASVTQATKTQQEYEMASPEQIKTVQDIIREYRDNSERRSSNNLDTIHPKFRIGEEDFKELQFIANQGNENLQRYFDASQKEINNLFFNASLSSDSKVQMQKGKTAQVAEFVHALTESVPFAGTAGAVVAVGVDQLGKMRRKTRDKNVQEIDDSGSVITKERFAEKLAQSLTITRHFQSQESSTNIEVDTALGKEDSNKACELIRSGKLKGVEKEEVVENIVERVTGEEVKTLENQKKSSSKVNSLDQENVSSVTSSSSSSNNSSNDEMMKIVLEMQRKMLEQEKQIADQQKQMEAQKKQMEVQKNKLANLEKGSDSNQDINVESGQNMLQLQKKVQSSAKTSESSRRSSVEDLHNKQINLEKQLGVVQEQVNLLTNAVQSVNEESRPGSSVGGVDQSKVKKMKNELFSSEENLKRAYHKM